MAETVSRDIAHLVCPGRRWTEEDRRAAVASVYLELDKRKRASERGRCTTESDAVIDATPRGIAVSYLLPHAPTGPNPVQSRLWRRLGGNLYHQEGWAGAVNNLASAIIASALGGDEGYPDAVSFWETCSARCTAHVHAWGPPGGAPAHGTDAVALLYGLQVKQFLVVAARQRPTNSECLALIRDALAESRAGRDASPRLDEALGRLAARLVERWPGLRNPRATAAVRVAFDRREREAMWLERAVLTTRKYLKSAIGLGRGRSQHLLNALGRRLSDAVMARRLEHEIAMLCEELPAEAADERAGADDQLAAEERALAANEDRLERKVRPANASIDHYILAAKCAEEKLTHLWFPPDQAARARRQFEDIGARWADLIPHYPLEPASFNADIWPKIASYTSAEEFGVYARTRLSRLRAQLRQGDRP